MGRYSALLSPQLADLAGVRAGQRVLDVGCGPGALTAELVAAARAGGRHGRRPLRAVRGGGPRAPPGRSSVQQAVRGAACRSPTTRSMRRWRSSSSTSWPTRPPASRRCGGSRAPRRRGRRVRLGPRRRPGPAQRASGRSRTRARSRRPRRVRPRGRARRATWRGCSRRRGCATSRRRRSPSASSTRRFEDWWEPYTLGVGPAGAYVAGLDPERRTQLRERCREALPDAPFVLTARAWTARGLA